MCNPYAMVTFPLFTDNRYELPTELALSELKGPFKAHFREYTKLTEIEIERDWEKSFGLVSK